MQKDIERAIYFKELDAQKQREQFRSESERYLFYLLYM
jgi:hypothetical protein